MRSLLILLSFVLISLAITCGAKAQNLENQITNTSEACNIPRETPNIAETDTAHWGFCDGYMRQFEYRKKQKELQARLNKRAENFKASTAASKARYEEALKDHYASLKD